MITHPCFVSYIIFTKKQVYHQYSLLVVVESDESCVQSTQNTNEEGQEQRRRKEEAGEKMMSTRYHSPSLTDISYKCLYFLGKETERELQEIETFHHGFHFVQHLTAVNRRRKTMLKKSQKSILSSTTDGDDSGKKPFLSF